MADDDPSTRALQLVAGEVQTVLAAVSPAQLQAVASELTGRRRRWFFAGQGRSGLIAKMAAMRIMHLGFQTHVVGEATAPAIGPNDGLVLFSGSGQTPVTLHLARLAHGFGAHLVAVTTGVDSALAALADQIIVIPVAGTEQFGGSLFEQAALLVSDALALQIAAGTGTTHQDMAARHTNLQ